MKVFFFFFPKKDLCLAVVLPFWDCFKQKFKAWGSLEYPSSVGKAGLPLVHPYPKGGALWSPSLFPQGSPTWLPTLCYGLWFQFPLCCEIIKKQIQNFRDQQMPSGQKQILCSLTSLGFCFPFSFDLIIPGNSLQRAYLSALWCFNKMLFLLYLAFLALFSWRVGPKNLASCF